MKSKWINRFSNISLYIIAILLILVLFYCSISALQVTANMEYTMDEATYFTKDSLLRNALYLLSLVIIYYCLIQITKRICPKHLFYLCTVILVIFLVYLIQSINLTPTWDAYRCYMAAENLLNGDYSMFQVGNYISDYPFQIPLVLYNILIIRIFGSNYLVPQFLNLLYLCGIYHTFYQITSILSDQNETAEKLCILFSTTFLPLSMYIMFIYSNLIGLFFSVFGLLQAIKWSKTYKTRHLVCAYVGIGIGSLFKGLFYIELIALLIFSIIHIMKQPKRKSIITMIVCLITILNSSNILNHLVSTLDSSISLNEQLFVEYGIEMGSKRSLRGAGWHDGWLESYTNDNFSTTAEKEAFAKQVIHENFSILTSDTSTFISFYKDKLNSMWTTPEFEGFWTIEANKLDTLGKGDTQRQSFFWIQYNPASDTLNAFTESFMTGDLNRAIRAYLNAFQNLIYLAVLFGILSDTLRKQLRWDQLLLPLTFLGGFLFLILWEAKAQYSILYYVLLFPYAAQSIAKLFKKFNLRFLHNNSTACYNHKD